MAAIVSQNFHLIQQRVVDHLRQKRPDMLTYTLGSGIAYWKMHLHTILPSIKFSPLDLPSKLVDRISKGDPNRFRKFAWLAPAIGITSLTLGCYVAYISIPYAFLKGVIATVHLEAMRVLLHEGRRYITRKALEPNENDELIYKIITLNNVLGMYFNKREGFGPHHDTHTINWESIGMSLRSEFRVYLVAGAFVALGWLVNPILTTTVLSLASAVYVVVCNQLSPKSA